MHQTPILAMASWCEITGYEGSAAVFLCSSRRRKTTHAKIYPLS